MRQETHKSKINPVCTMLVVAMSYSNKSNKRRLKYSNRTRTMKGVGIRSSSSISSVCRRVHLLLLSLLVVIHNTIEVIHGATSSTNSTTSKIEIGPLTIRIFDVPEFPFVPIDSMLNVTYAVLHEYFAKEAFPDNFEQIGITLSDQKSIYYTTTTGATSSTQFLFNAADAKTYDQKQQQQQKHYGNQFILMGWIQLQLPHYETETTMNQMTSSILNDTSRYLTNIQQLNDDPAFLNVVEAYVLSLPSSHAPTRSPQTAASTRKPRQPTTKPTSTATTTTTTRPVTTAARPVTTATRPITRPTIAAAPTITNRPHITTKSPYHRPKPTAGTNHVPTASPTSANRMPADSTAVVANSTQQYHNKKPSTMAPTRAPISSNTFSSQNNEEPYLEFNSTQNNTGRNSDNINDYGSSSLNSNATNNHQRRIMYYSLVAVAFILISLWWFGLYVVIGKKRRAGRQQDEVGIIKNHETKMNNSNNNNSNASSHIFITNDDEESTYSSSKAAQNHQQLQQQVLPTVESNNTLQDIDFLADFSQVPTLLEAADNNNTVTSTTSMNKKSQQTTMTTTTPTTNSNGTNVDGWDNRINFVLDSPPQRKDNTTNEQDCMSYVSSPGHSTLAFSIESTNLDESNTTTTIPTDAVVKHRRRPLFKLDGSFPTTATTTDTNTNDSNPYYSNNRYYEFVSQEPYNTNINNDDDNYFSSDQSSCAPPPPWSNTTNRNGGGGEASTFGGTSSSCFDMSSSTSRSATTNDLQGKRIWDEYLAHQQQHVNVVASPLLIDQNHKSLLFVSKRNEIPSTSEASSFSTGVSSTTVGSDVSRSKELIQDILWLEKKIADRATTTTTTTTTTHLLAAEDNYYDDYCFDDDNNDNTSTTNNNEQQQLHVERVSTCHDCFAPPGKLNIIIRSSIDGPVVHTVDESSALRGQLFKGDLIIAVDDADTRNMRAEAVMKLMHSKLDRERKISVLHFEDEDE